MSGVLLITHGNIGQDMLDTVTTILGGCPLDTLAIGVAADCDPDDVYATASQSCASLDDGGGVLVPGKTGFFLEDSKFALAKPNRA